MESDAELRVFALCEKWREDSDLNKLNAIQFYSKLDSKQMIDI